MRVLQVTGSAEARGRRHGELHGASIRSYAADRTRLSATGTDLDRSRILGLAERMLDAHEAYDADLFVEMIAMAETAGISPAEAVIVGGYTDFIDAVRTFAGGTAVEDTCTAVIVPDDLADGAGFLAQTWDMHASATQHVVMLDVRPEEGPTALTFTTVGTLGQIGLNSAGVSVGINNLTTDGAIGVTWPFVVRKVLAQTSFDDALACIVDAPLAGGHSFLLFADGRGAIVEATPSVREVATLDTEPLIHTNHCLTPAARAVEGDRPIALQESSTDRLADAAELLASRPVTVDALMELTRDERSIARRPNPPFDYETSGAIIMRPADGDCWACWGNPADGDYEHFRVPHP